MSPLRPLLESETLRMQFPICALSLPIAQISAQLELPVESWQELGVGEARGFGCHLPNGMMVFLDEFLSSPQSGTTVHVDASALVGLDVNEVVSAALGGLGLPVSFVTWLQAESNWKAAQEIAEAAGER
ncbi:hypothetical protein D9M72_357430 [compost metagenome]